MRYLQKAATPSARLYSRRDVERDTVVSNKRKVVLVVSWILFSEL
jgi:hypothetical protein